MLEFDKTGEVTGSSPRMRGTPCCVHEGVVRMRIIPAYAGNARNRGLGTRSSTDHPRVCGERVVITPAGEVYVGSSPRMRGTHNPHPAYLRDLRIIPAYAGNAPSR